MVDLVNSGGSILPTSTDDPPLTDRRLAFCALKAGVLRWQIEVTDRDPSMRKWRNWQTRRT
jgi:hypothetical protein